MMLRKRLTIYNQRQMISNNIITTRKVVQNNQEFLIGTFPISQVLTFTKYTQHLIVGYEEVADENKIVYSDHVQFKPIYNPEIQRKTNNAKIEKIADFLIYDPNAMFPTNIVISIPSQVIDDYKENNTDVTITLNEIVKRELDKEDGDVFLTIIDGQHRIKGIISAIEQLESKISTLNSVLNKNRNPNLFVNDNTNTTENADLANQLLHFQTLLSRLKKFELLVTFFIDPTLEYQAMLFATINKTQTKVPENLVFSLFGLTKDDSPQKSSLEVVLALNGIEKSPFYNRVKLVGASYQRGTAIPLSQATMVKSILNYISVNAREAEKDRFKKRSELNNSPKYLPFRKYYANNDDRKIVRIMFSFFSAVRSTFKNSSGVSLWEMDDHGITNVLHTNVGYLALLKVLSNILMNIPEDLKDSKNKYEQILAQVQGIDFEDSGNEKRYPFTSASVNTLYEDIMHKISTY